MAFSLQAPAQPRPTSSLSNVTHGYPPSSDSSDIDNDDVPLPFPAALPRSDFLAPNFQPAAYLSNLPHRHQTLEDLRSDLRERSAAISAELLELVNSNYTSFLSLGSELRGGDEKVEDVRVALLGFRRATEEVRGKVAKRRQEAEVLNNDLRNVRTEIEHGRMMLETSERLTSLEEGLSLGSGPQQGDDSDWGDDRDEDQEEDEKSRDLPGSSPAKLLEPARECSRIAATMKKLDQDHPFVIKMEERFTRCRNTLLIDLASAMKQARQAGSKGHERVLRYLAIYRMLDAQTEAVKALRDK